MEVKMGTLHGVRRRKEEKNKNKKTGVVGLFAIISDTSNHFSYFISKPFELHFARY